MKVCVIGGSNLDMVAESYEALTFHDSNPGKLSKSLGGVGRNVAENLGLLNVDVSLITVLGNNPDGAMIQSETEKRHVKVHPILKESQPTYLAVLDDQKDMHVAISSMDAMDEVDVHEIEAFHKVYETADLVMIDTNFSELILDYCFNTIDKPIYVDAISTSKVHKISPHLNKIYTLKLNQMEAKALTGTSDIIQSIQILLEKGVTNIYITVGSEGVYYGNHLEGINHVGTEHVDVVNATGAGDAFLAGLIYGAVHHLDALRVAMNMAKITLESIESVSKQLTEEKLLKLMEESK